MEKKARFSREDLWDAMFHDASTTTWERYTMRKLIAENSDAVEILSDAKDNKGQYLLGAKDINRILYNCQNEIKNNPENLKEVLNNPEQVENIAASQLRFERFSHALKALSTMKKNPNTSDLTKMIMAKQCGGKGNNI